MVMNEVTSRFLQVYNKLTESGIIANAKEFAAAIGISPSMMTEVLKGRSNVGIEPIQKTVSIYHISPTFLLTGQGPAFSSPAANRSKRKAEPDGKDIPVPDSPGFALAGAERRASGFIRLPHSMIEAGGEYRCVCVENGNMSPSIPGGSRLIVRMLTDSPQRLEEGEIYTVWDNEGQQYTGRMRPQPGQQVVACISDHPDKTAYPDISLPTGNIRAIGRTEWVISRPQGAISQALGQKIVQLEEELATFNAKLQEISNLLNK